MKVKELIEKLNDVDPDVEIIMSRDAEGNGYSKLWGVIIDEYNYRSVGYGVEIGLAHLTPDDIDLGYSEEDVILNGDPCVIFWPV